MTEKNLKILLGLLPFWTPWIPPLGISCLKSFLQEHGYRVKTVDANTEESFKDSYSRYFRVLKNVIPQDKQGNFYNIGHDLLQHHMMAHINHTDEKVYIELVETLAATTFFTGITTSGIRELNTIVSDFFYVFEDYFLGLLEGERPDVLGLSVFRGTVPASLFACKLAREAYPHMKIVLGGGIFSQELEPGSENLRYLLEDTPYVDYIDGVFVGEGEILFLKWLQGELPAGQKVYMPDHIDREVVDLGSVKPPDFTDFDLNRYLGIAVYSSRSCPFQCSFCAETVYWGKYRKKKARHVALRMRQLAETYHRRLFVMCDSLLDPVVTDLAREVLKTGMALYWDGYLRADKQACEPGMALLWRRGGLYRARLGVESGSRKVLELMNKNITLHQVKQSISTLARTGIKTTTYWVIGHPGETESDFRQTLDLLAELQDDIYEAECNPFRYFETGQVNSSEWKQNRKRVLLYPDNTRSLLLTRTWTLEGEPSRSETMERVNRFVCECSRLGIPNPYSLQEIDQADERWKKLHKNAVPSFLELTNKKDRIDESMELKPLLQGDNKFDAEGEFDF